MSPVSVSCQSESSGEGDGARGNFRLIAACKANGLIDVRKYKSTKTGVTVVIAQVEGPVVNGYFALATETLDDCGLPHTLEHLIFLGSEDYPYKGVLDLLANRNLASGTNAWTDTDHTCYTMTTAGSEGFLSLMPVYLDHILYPTLTDAGFVTEVHHINGQGKDAGVVYSEMQGCENSGEKIAHRVLERMVYPGRCGYKSETGGIMKDLRETTSIEKVREYHREYYRPENLTLVVTGQVDDADVFKALEPFEQKIISKGDRGPFTRPWQSPVEPVAETIEFIVPYPSDTEDNGMVYVGWQGPSAVTELYLMSACSILMKYLTDTSISPLQKEFVEIEDSMASAVCYSLQENSVSLLYFMFENVPYNKLGLVKTRLDFILAAIAREEEPINMGRLRTVIHRQKLETLQNLETQPHDAIAFMALGDMLYGHNNKDFYQRLNQVVDLETMALEPEGFWRGLLSKYLVEGRCVGVIATPSCGEREDMSRNEEHRVAKQKERLGPAGLLEKGRLLKEAIEHNEIPPPLEMLTQTPIPDPAKIRFHSVRSFTTDSEEQHCAFDTRICPVYMYLDDVKTNFVYMSVLMNTTNLPTALRPYLPLFLEALLESPVQRGNTLVPYEHVVAQLEADTICTASRIGADTAGRFACGSYTESAVILLQVESSKYQQGVTWLRELLFCTKLTKERIKVIATKMMNDVAQVKRNGNKITQDLSKCLWYGPDTNLQHNIMLRQHSFLQEVVARLEKSAEDTKNLLQDFEVLRGLLTTPSNMVVHLAANVSGLVEMHGDIAQTWRGLLPEGVAPARTSVSVPADVDLYRENTLKPACVVGMGCVESSFLVLTVPCIRDFNNPDLPALMVYLQYLTQLEGPMWRQIRGVGLAYGSHLFPRPTEGLLYMVFFKAADLLGTFREAKAIIEKHVGMTAAEFDPTLLDSARSSMIFEVIEKERTVECAVAQSFLSYFKGVSHDYNQSLVRRVGLVTAEDLVRVGSKYVAPLLIPNGGRMSVVCHPTKVDDIADTLKGYNFDIEVYKSVEDSFLRPT